MRWKIGTCFQCVTSSRLLTYRYISCSITVWPQTNTKPDLTSHRSRKLLGVRRWDWYQNDGSNLYFRSVSFVFTAKPLFLRKVWKPVEQWVGCSTFAIFHTRWSSISGDFVSNASRFARDYSSLNIGPILEWLGALKPQDQVWFLKTKTNCKPATVIF